MPESFALSATDLLRGDGSGMALLLGRLRATVISKRTGRHIAVRAVCEQRGEGERRWHVVSFIEADRVTLEVPRRGAPGDPIGHLIPEKGIITPPWGESFDAARLWAARFVLDVAAGRAETDSARARLELGTHCMSCGQALDDPESIARGLGQDCFEQATSLAAKVGQHEPRSSGREDESAGSSGPTHREPGSVSGGDSGVARSTASVPASRPEDLIPLLPGESAIEKLGGLSGPTHA